MGMRVFETGGKGLDRREEVRMAPGIWPAALGRSQGMGGGAGLGEGTEPSGECEGSAESIDGQGWRLELRRQI